MGDEFLQQFGLRLARLLNPGLPLQTVQTAILQVIAEARGAGSLPPALDRDRLALGDAAHIGGVAGRKMELVFVHDCRLVLSPVRIPASVTRGQVPRPILKACLRDRRPEGVLA